MYSSLSKQLLDHIYSPSYQMRLEGKVIIVTGAARGIGKAYALALAKEGANIVVSDIIADGANSTVSEIQKTGGKAVAVIGDISRENDTNRIAEESAKKFGRIDVLINNAARNTDLKWGPFYEINVEEWGKVMAVNLRGTWLCIKAVFPYMKAQSGGKIINISSGTFFLGTPGLAHYVASKAGVIGLTRALSKELGQYNITINAIAPGLTITEVNADVFTPTYLVETRKSKALQRDQYPSDLVGTMLYLCSPDSDFMTGQTLVVDGGRHMH
ncbi:MAG: SDR family NAD(P)-dependent oxidoreductase [Rhabdochlamydiaceae bacterium]